MKQKKPSSNNTSEESGTKKDKHNLNKECNSGHSDQNRRKITIIELMGLWGNGLLG